MSCGRKEAKHALVSRISKGKDKLVPDCGQRKVCEMWDVHELWKECL